VARRTLLLQVDLPAEDGAVRPPAGEEEAAVEGAGQLGDVAVAQYRLAPVGVPVQRQNLEPHLGGGMRFTVYTIQIMCHHNRIEE